MVDEYKNTSKKERDILHEYIAEKNLKNTKQRQSILDVFLGMETHASAEDVYNEITKEDPSIGLATVYRTMNLFVQCGLAQKRQFEDRHIRYEHHFKHDHHDHLICNSCGKIVEFSNPIIESLQNEVAKDNDFDIYSHKLEIYGLCRICSSKSCDSDE